MPERGGAETLPNKAIRDNFLHAGLSKATKGSEDGAEGGWGACGWVTYVALRVHREGPQGEGPQGRDTGRDKPITYLRGGG